MFLSKGVRLLSRLIYFRTRIRSICNILIFCFFPPSKLLARSHRRAQLLYSILTLGSGTALSSCCSRFSRTRAYNTSIIFVLYYRNTLLSLQQCSKYLRTKAQMFSTFGTKFARACASYVVDISKAAYIASCYNTALIPHKKPEAWRRRGLARPTSPFCLLRPHYRLQHDNTAV